MLSVASRIVATFVDQQASIYQMSMRKGETTGSGNEPGKGEGSRA